MAKQQIEEYKGGFFKLKGYYKEGFRQPLFQGHVECLFVLFFFFMEAGYSNQWHRFQNAMAYLLIGTLHYFETSFLSVSIPPLLLHTVYLAVCKQSSAHSV